MNVPNIVLNLSKKKIDFKGLHFTDIHLMNTTICANRAELFKQKVLNTDISFLINGGDTIHDNNPLAAWTNLKAILLNKCPMIVTRGNHDFAYNNAELGLPSNYYTYDFGSTWRFIVLYSQGGGNYSLGATQMAWLQSTLAASTDKNICISSHVPILGVSAMMWYLRNNQGWCNTVDMHSDAKAILDLLKLYPNVKLCLSGHEHTIDEVEHEGIKFACSGSVAANWYADTSYIEKGYPAGYRVIDFYKDGTTRLNFITY